MPLHHKSPQGARAQSLAFLCTFVCAQSFLCLALFNTVRFLYAAGSPDLWAAYMCSCLQGVDWPLFSHCTGCEGPCGRHHTLSQILRSKVLQRGECLKVGIRWWVRW